VLPVDMWVCPKGGYYPEKWSVIKMLPLQYLDISLLVWDIHCFFHFSPFQLSTVLVICEISEICHFLVDPMQEGYLVESHVTPKSTKLNHVPPAFSKPKKLFSKVIQWLYPHISWSNPHFCLVVHHFSPNFTSIFRFSIPCPLVDRWCPGGSGALRDFRWQCFSECLAAELRSRQDAELDIGLRFDVPWLPWCGGLGG